MEKKKEHVFAEGEYSGYVDDYEKELCLGDKVTLFGKEFTVMYYCGAWGIGSKDGNNNIPWTELKKYLPSIPCNDDTGFFSRCDCFISFWELAYNFIESGDELDYEIPLINGSADDPDFVYSDWKKENERNEK